LVYLFGIAPGGMEKIEDGFKEVDTVSIYADVAFIADDKSYKTYEWIIGTDPLHRFGPSMSLSFKLKKPETIAITLIVEGKPDKNCQNKKDWRDTFTKYVHFTEFTNFALNGKYYGYHTENVNEKFEVTIRSNNTTGWAQIVGLKVDTKGGTGRYGDTAVNLGRMINNYATFTNGEGMNRPEGVINLNTKTNEIDVTYTVIEPWHPTKGGVVFKKYIFKGKKIK